MKLFGACEEHNASLSADQSVITRNVASMETSLWCHHNKGEIVIPKRGLGFMFIPGRKYLGSVLNMPMKTSKILLKRIVWDLLMAGDNIWDETKPFMRFQMSFMSFKRILSRLKISRCRCRFDSTISCRFLNLVGKALKNWESLFKWILFYIAIALSRMKYSAEFWTTPLDFIMFFKICLSVMMTQRFVILILILSRLFVCRSEFMSLHFDIYAYDSIHLYNSILT